VIIMSNEAHPLKKIIEDLKTEKIAHEKYLRAYNQCYSHLTFADPGDFVLLYGPSRVGKSRLSSNLVEDISSNGSPLGAIRVIVNPGRSADQNFVSKNLILSVLDKLQHPFYSKDQYSETHGFGYFERENSENEERLHLAMINSIKAKKTRYIVLDEAQHILHAKNKKLRMAFLDSWKAMAEELGIVVLLSGTYELLEAVRGATHLIGRSSMVEFPRYHVSKKEDLVHFSDAVYTYEQGVLASALNEIKLKKFYKELAIGSIGCIGHLRKWLLHALQDSMMRQLDYFDPSSIFSTRKTAYEISQLEADVGYGESLANTFIDEGQKPRGLGKKKHKKGRPFQANARRYTVV